MRGNKYKLETRKGKRQHQLRKYWTTHETFVTMYGRLYAAIMDEKVATPQEEPE